MTLPTYYSLDSNLVTVAQYRVYTQDSDDIA